ncbi:nuclear transport factor 2 family protein [Marinobacter sp. M1N3S26]|uniref:nuclear transport factor 2 family protein n=1 Tax=Marinobacter sp. M1N3S26 TaxID=3382299 RepID=UPI00387B6B27
MTRHPSSAAATDIRQHESVAVTVERFQRLFNTLSAGRVTGLAEVYSEQVRFVDPFSSVEGLEELQAYLDKVYTNVTACRFEFDDTLVSGDQACIEWTMHLQHPRLRRGRELAVHGISRLTIAEGRVRYHRDYFDAGELLYENLPLLGSAVRLVRSFAS